MTGLDPRLERWLHEAEERVKAAAHFRADAVRTEHAADIEAADNERIERDKAIAIVCDAWVRAGQPVEIADRVLDLPRAQHWLTDAAADPDTIEAFVARALDQNEEEFRSLVHPITGEPVAGRLAERTAFELLRQEAQALAKTITSERDCQPVPSVLSLQNALDNAPDQEPPRIERILPADFRALVVARRKLGKSTVITNVVEAITTGGLLFDRWRCRKGRILVLNYEVLAHQWATWCADAGVPLDAAYVLSLRGVPNPFGSARGRRELAAQLADLGIDVLVVDPYGAATRGVSDEENSNSQGRAFLGMLDEVMVDAGVRELIMPAHAGKAGEDARGASVIEDWADAIWTLTTDHNGSRFFAAMGRDVDVPEEMLQFNHQNRRLSFPARPVNRANAGYVRGAQIALEHIAANPGCIVREVAEALQDADVPGAAKSGVVSAWLARLVRKGELVQVAGAKNAKHNYIPGTEPTERSSA